MAIADGVTLEAQERPIRGKIGRERKLKGAVRPAGRSLWLQPEQATHGGQDYAIGRKQLMRHGELAGEIAISIHQFRDSAGRGKPDELRDATPNGKTGERESVAVLRPGSKSAHERPRGAVVVTQGIVERVGIGEPAHTPVRGEAGLGKDGGRRSGLLRIHLIGESKQHAGPDANQIRAMSVSGDAKRKSM